MTDLITPLRRTHTCPDCSGHLTTIRIRLSACTPSYRTLTQRLRVGRLLAA
jgi:hypothetical protein